MQRTATGFRIRERRRELGLKQVELAAKVGVSPSYLNLIEANKRRIGGALLARIGKELGLSGDQLDGAAERRLRDALEEMAQDPEIAPVDARLPPPDEVIARHPAWARLAAAAHRRKVALAGEVETMADRLAHDPALGQAVHEMLTEITALRSTSEILFEAGAADPGEMGETESGASPAAEPMAAEQRRRFEEIMYEQSGRLARTGAALAAYFDQRAGARRTRTAASDAEDALAAIDGLARRIEAEAETARAEIGAAGGDLVVRLEAALPAAVAVSAAPTDDGWLGRRDKLALAFAETRFAAFITAVAGEGEAALGAEWSDAAEPFALADDARALARRELARRLADALILPLAEFRSACARVGWEVEAAARIADDDMGLAMRRIACAAPPGEEAGETGESRVAHVSVDAAGRLLARRGAVALLPRARQLDCPVWPAHRTGRGAVSAAPVRLHDDRRAMAVAWRRPDGMASEMLLLNDAAARASVYAAAAVGAPLEVGPDCRICGHAACPWRREEFVAGL